MKVKEKTA